MCSFGEWTISLCSKIIFMHVSHHPTIIVCVKIFKQICLNFYKYTTCLNDVCLVIRSVDRCEFLWLWMSSCWHEDEIIIIQAKHVIIVMRWMWFRNTFQQSEWRLSNRYKLIQLVYLCGFASYSNTNNSLQSTHSL